MYIYVYYLQHLLLWFIKTGKFFLPLRDHIILDNTINIFWMVYGNKTVFFYIKTQPYITWFTTSSGPIGFCLCTIVSTRVLCSVNGKCILFLQKRFSNETLDLNFITWVVESIFHLFFLHCRKLSLLKDQA